MIPLCRHFRTLLVAITLATVLASSRNALAHGGERHDVADDDGAVTTIQGPRNWSELARTWGWEPLPIVSLALSAYLYARGVRRTWRDAGTGHGVATWEAAAFAGGWFFCFVALVSPLHPWGQVLFSAHMTQHEVLMLAAAPLMVLGRPMVAFLRALPPGWSRALARASNGDLWQRTWTAISNPFSAFVVHGVALWAWHIPTLFQATLHNEWVHAAQHSSFLFTALLFWWSLIHVRNRAVGYGAAALYMFTTALHTNLLGALLTFARTVWYPDYARTAPLWGLTALEDQQLGGIVMWIPAGVVYIIAGVALVAGWMRESDRLARAAERTHDIAFSPAARAAGAAGAAGAMEVTP
jgi:cytochrome c oxidase assembly factor CtaG